MRPIRIILLTLVLLSQAAFASACINDRESEKSEKEFKSRYIDVKPEPAPEVSPPAKDNLLVYGGSTVGAGLLLAAFGLCVSRKQS
jgi:hypothetical protein